MNYTILKNQPCLKKICSFHRSDMVHNYLLNKIKLLCLRVKNSKTHVNGKISSDQHVNIVSIELNKDI